MVHFKTISVQFLLVFISHNPCTTMASTEDISALGAEYLHTAIRDIQQQNAEYMSTIMHHRRKLIHTPRVRHLEPNPDMYSTIGTGNRRSDSYLQQNPESTSNTDVPPLSLTKGELMAIYEAAIANGNTVKLNGLANDNSQQPLHAAVHELQDTYNQNTLQDSVPASSNHQQGYYYYYYPLKSFFNDLQHEVQKEDYTKLGSSLQSALHSHHVHQNPVALQHNVKIEPIKAMMEMSNKSKALEPLFMAISGFIGMALMFVFSMVILPKLKFKKRREMRSFGNTYDQIYALGSVISELIENYDCKSCDMHRTLKVLNVHNNSLKDS